MFMFFIHGTPVYSSPSKMIIYTWSLVIDNECLQCSCKLQYCTVVCINHRSCLYPYHYCRCYYLPVISFASPPPHLHYQHFPRLTHYVIAIKIIIHLHNASWNVWMRVSNKFVFLTAYRLIVVVDISFLEKSPIVSNQLLAGLLISNNYHFYM